MGFHLHRAHQLMPRKWYEISDDFKNGHCFFPLQLFQMGISSTEYDTHTHKSTISKIENGILTDGHIKSIRK